MASWVIGTSYLGFGRNTWGDEETGMGPSTELSSIRSGWPYDAAGFPYRSTGGREALGQPLIRVEILADAEGLKVRLAIAPSILTQVYARDGLGLFDRSTANVAVELRDQRDGRHLERQPILVEFVPGSEDAEEYAPKFRPGSALELT